MKRTSVMLFSWLMAATAMAQPQGRALHQLRRMQSDLPGASVEVPQVGAEKVAGPRFLTGLPTAPAAGGGILRQISDEMTGLYQKVSPSVVMIIIAADEAARRAIAHKQLDEQLDKQMMQAELEKRFMKWLQGQGEALLASADQIGTGSGFVIDPSGLILTNGHVVADVAEGAIVAVKFVDGTTVPGKVLKIDAMRDVALVQAQVSKPLPALTLGNSDRARVGQVVCALGNPLGFESVFTCGSITALNPEMGIQHDAPITNGSSGGPLLDVNGQVIGINAMVIKGEGGGVEPGMGFAIPINAVKEQMAK